MTMRLDARFLKGDKLEKWITYTAKDGSCDMLAAFPEPAEWQAFFASRKGKENDGGDPAFREFLAAHVKDWRGILNEDGTVTPFTASGMNVFLRRDAKLSLWLMETLNDAASFRCPAGDGEAGAAGVADAAAAAG